jgi:hypothetical protein
VGGALTLLPRDEWYRLFDEFAHTAFRLEVRDRYDVPSDTATLERFAAGRPVQLVPRPWLDRVRRATRSGRTIRRVRIVTTPLNDYCRLGVASAAASNAAGEDIRYLDREEARSIGLPDHQDWWLFDSHRLLRLHFDDQDRALGGELVIDPIAVVDANRWRDLAWHHAWLRETFSTG